MVLLLSAHIVEDGLDMCRDGILGGEAVASAEDLHLAVSLGESGADVFKQRLAGTAGLLGPVEDRDRLHGLGDRVKQVAGRERTVQMDLHHADLFALRSQVVHDFHHGFADRTHRDHDTLRIGGTVVVEELVIPAGEGIDGVHLLLNNSGQGVVRGVAGFTGLEEGIRVLKGGTDGRVLGV